MSKAISFINFKGDVGKSIIACNIVAVGVLFLIVGCVSNKPRPTPDSLHGTAIGRVLFNGKPVPSRTVYLIRLLSTNKKDQLYPLIKKRFKISASTVTDYDGRFKFERVWSGEYFVSGYESQDGFIEIPVENTMHVWDGKVTDFGDIKLER